VTLAVSGDPGVARGVLAGTVCLWLAGRVFVRGNA
jgi:hypothetical protein